MLSAPGCTTMVVDAYQARVMRNPMYIWLADYEEPEIHVYWSRRPPAENSVATQLLTIRPGLDGCQFYEIYVNARDAHLEDSSAAILYRAVPTDAALIPDERFPDCTVLLTYRRLNTRPGYVLTAATREGVIAEFPNRKRQPAWLLLMPFAAVADGAGFLALVFVMSGGLFMSGGGATTW
jgi:hypothetical protein